MQLLVLLASPCPSCPFLFQTSVPICKVMKDDAAVVCKQT